MNKPSIIIIDYGFGNLHSLAKALIHLGVAPVITQQPEDIERADAVFLPGVGAFGQGMSELSRRGFFAPLKEYASSGKPLFGICLGMQFLFEYSEEFGTHEGLGLLSGGVKKIVPRDEQCKIPHIGWNELQFSPGRTSWSNTILDGIPERSQTYFAHSYAAVPSETSDILANTEYGGSVFTSVVAKGGIMGTQFHPEKSGETGLRILKNFLAKI